MQKKNAPSLVAIVVALAASGCAAQAEPDYPGESLATLQGELSADDDFAWPADASEIQVGVLWLVSSPDGGREPLVGETAATSGQFPFGFQIDLYAPPPREAQGYRCLSGDLPCTDPLPIEVYQGPLAAFAAGADLGRLRNEDILGVSLEHGVLYFGRDADAADPVDDVQATASAFNVPATRGYHLYTIAKDAQRYADLRRCEANGLCVNAQVGGGEAAREQQAQRFDECQVLLPAALTCTSHPEVCRSTPDGGVECTSYYRELGIQPSAEQAAEDERCAQLAAQHAPPPECGELPSPWSFPGNTQGFDAEVAVELGASLFDWFN